MRGKEGSWRLGKKKYVKLKKFQLLLSLMEAWFLVNGGIVRPPGGNRQTNNLCNFQATINSLRPRELRGLS